MTIQDWILATSTAMQVMAVLLAPIIALWVTEKRQKSKEKIERKNWLFRTLMATRGTCLAPEHVQALNMIDIEFYGSKPKDKKVIEAWKAYLDLLNTTTMSEELWSRKREELLLDLLNSMAENLGYELSKTTIKSTSYFPVGHANMENEQTWIRKGFSEIFQGKRAFPVTLYEKQESEK